MKTPFLDKELNRLEIGFKGKQLTEEGIAKRNEFMAIKKALDKLDVSGRSEQLCVVCSKNFVKIAVDGCCSEGCFNAKKKRN